MPTFYLKLPIAQRRELWVKIISGSPITYTWLSIHYMASPLADLFITELSLFRFLLVFISGEPNSQSNNVMHANFHRHTQQPFYINILLVK